MFKRDIPAEVKAALPAEAIEKLQEGYGLIVLKKGEEAKVTEGSSYFGSGDYSAYYEVLRGNVRVIDKKSWDNGFVSAVDYIITATETPTVVCALASDGISRSGRRYFQREIIVWL